MSHLSLRKLCDSPQIGDTLVSLGITAMLTLLDQNRNGSIVDDVTSIIGRFMKRS